MRIIDPEVYGSFTKPIIWYGIIELLTSFNIHTLLVQKQDFKNLKAYFSLGRLLVVFKFSLSVVVAVTIMNSLRFDLLMVFIVYSCFKSLSVFNALRLAIFDANEKWVKSSIFTGLTNTAGVITAIAVASCGFAVAGLLVREVFSVGLLYYILWRSRSNRVLHISEFFDLKRGIKLFKNNKDLLIGMYTQRFAELAHSRGILLAAERYLTVRNLGFFSQAYYLVNLSNRVLSQLTQQIAIVVFSNKERYNTQKVFRKMRILIVSLTLLPTLALFTYPNFFIDLIWGDTWIGMAEYTKRLSFLVIVLPLFSLTKSNLLANKQPTYITSIYILGSAAFVLSMLFSCNNFLISLVCSFLVIFSFSQFLIHFLTYEN